MVSWRWFFVVGVVLFAAPVQASDPAARFAEQALPVLKTHCVGCHGGDKPKAKVNLAGPRSAEQLANEKDLWFRVLAQIETGTMPPDSRDPLSPQDRDALVGWIRGELTTHLAAQQRQNGRAMLRRLSRTEYANTIQDLFGVRPRVDLYLPEDGRVDGYDKVSPALPLAADGALGYFLMADELLKTWILKPRPKTDQSDPANRTVRALAMESGESKGHTLVLEDDTKVSFNSDTSSGRLKHPGIRTPGLHRLRLSVYGYQTDKPLPFGIYIGNTTAFPQILELAQILEAPPGKATVLETEVYLDRGGMRLIPFGLGVPVPKNSQASRCRAPGLAVQWVDDIAPPLPVPGDHWLTADFPESLDAELRLPRKVYLDPSKPKGAQSKATTRAEFLAVMRTTLERIVPRLYRRDVATQELNEMIADLGRRIDTGTALDDAFRDKVVELLMTPDFLCLVEPAGELNDFALASRLSYFLWSSTPDDVLLAVARSGRLREPAVLKEQTERLLNDPKASRFVNDFVDQWLGLRSIDETTPDGQLYPGYDALLKHSSVGETRAFFRRLLEENRRVGELIDPGWALVNEPLAKHYGLPPVQGIALREVALPADSMFGGIWTQSAVMKVTANGTNTSPVKRGVWVAERLLGTPIPPPPPNIEPVEPDVRGAKTLREQLALHRSGGACAACHAKFDPYGFALESFDVTGGLRQFYREVDPMVVKLPAHQRRGKSTWRNGLAVDPSGTTPDGQAFDNIVGLRKLLAKQPERLAHGVAHHLLTYATGAPATPLDESSLKAIVSATAGEDYRLRSLVHALVQNEAFRWK